MGQQGFWDFEARYQKLEGKKDFLSRLNRLVPWEMFRSSLVTVQQKPRKSRAGRKPTDVLLLFKLVILQKLYNISDAELEYQVNDRLSFMHFLGLGLEDKVPDATTVWLFKEQLKEHNLAESLFEQFERYLSTAGYQAQAGQILDATLIPVPKQRNTKAENQQLKQGEVPSAWSEQPRKLAQKDVDARWTKKHGVSHYGYKNHISSDVRFGFIRCYSVTAAAVHDLKELGNLLDGDNEAAGVWADSAYRAQDVIDVLELMGFEEHFNERAYRNQPLSEEQKAANRERSKVRSKVEHIFGSWVNEMGGKLLRSIGFERAKNNLGLKNLAYNLKRFVFWETLALAG